LTGKMTKRQAKKAKKNMRKHDKNLGPVEVAIPIEEQSVDLPTSDGSPESMKSFADAAKELTHAMRIKRRAAIKESNFLKSMS
jgi:large subunit ribosomal protein L54